jgi:hypothetical protein
MKSPGQKSADRVIGHYVKAALATQLAAIVGT